MIIAVSGITGVGKSYFKRCVAKELGIKNFLMVTTRPKRTTDVNGRDKWFVTDEEFEQLKKEGKLILEIKFIDNRYAYYTNEIKGDEDGITEIYFNEVENFKNACKQFLSIYIKPSNIEQSKEQLKKRNLDKKVYEARIKEMEYQLETFEKDKELQVQYDYIFTNDYTEKAKNDFINYIKEKMKGEIKL